MAKPTPKLTLLTCNRCQHQWVPRVETPKQCPNCTSQYWNKDRTRIAVAEAIRELGIEAGTTQG